MAEDWRNGGFGLYLHWPFCEAKCPYCDFNSHVARTIDQRRWADAFVREIDRVGQLVPDRVVNTIFFGGGTPSLMAPETVDAILTRIRATWPLANDIEITLEANPSSVEAGRFRAFAEAGVNRVSMGFQALNDDDLRRLGRIHTVAEGLAAFDTARSVFDRVSFDLIYARQGQTLAAWQEELAQALALGGDHLSLYQLTIEPGTAFGDRYAAGKLRNLPDDDLAADMYHATQEICAAAGLPAYEISNHARPGAKSRHNLIYWRYGDYAGIGPGAHGRLTMDGTRWATQTPLAPGAWLAQAEAGNGGLPPQPLSPLDQGGEYIMMGMRISEGIDMDRYHGLTGVELPGSALSDLQEHGLIEISGRNLRSTEKGRALLNQIILALLPDAD